MTYPLACLALSLIAGAGAGALVSLRVTRPLQRRLAAMQVEIAGLLPEPRFDRTGRQMPRPRLLNTDDLCRCRIGQELCSPTIDKPVFASNRRDGM